MTVSTLSPSPSKARPPHRTTVARRAAKAKQEQKRVARKAYNAKYYRSKRIKNGNASGTVLVESQRPPLAQYPPAAFNSPSRVLPTAGRVGVTCSSPVGSLGSMSSVLSANQEFLVSSAARSSAHKKNLSEIALEGHLKAMESIDSNQSKFYDFMEKASNEHDENENKILTSGLEMHPAYASQGGPPSTIGVPTAVSLQPSPRTLFTPAPDAAAASGTGALFSTTLAGGNSPAFTSPTAAPCSTGNAFAALASVGDANNKKQTASSSTGNAFAALAAVGNVKKKQTAFSFATASAAATTPPCSTGNFFLAAGGAGGKTSGFAALAALAEDANKKQPACHFSAPVAAAPAGDSKPSSQKPAVSLCKHKPGVAQMDVDPDL